ncbi:DegT/DnrJ/EryC1/StrS family aminotransferase [Kiloniella sp. b19]|uniref:DegT/DnrJ/EryC1/StrS family aminotransferase n=1 Tax=Kiloniella sp. GXU_MW_B19 TaxID=3141326 RepID=UPI0031E152F1
MPREPLYVTRPALPDYQAFCQLMEGVWERRFLTNCGPLHEELERSVAAYLQVEHVSLFNNATIALMAALRALDLEGEVITTPFTFAASGQALLWCGLEPVFVDVDPGTGNLDPALIEEAVTSRTSAILPVHCYGMPCDIQATGDVAARHGLRLVYDAAQAFGTTVQGSNLALAGDFSVYSFHATKVLNTFEGGLVVSPSAEEKKKIDRIRNFGLGTDGEILEQGLNGKMSEASAAMGLLQLETLEDAIAQRTERVQRYLDCLEDCEELGILKFPSSDVRWNAAYFPIRITDRSKRSREEVIEAFRQENIFPRRYFYPLLSNSGVFNASRKAGGLPVADSLSREILALPLYDDLALADIESICFLLKKFTCGL